MACLGLQRCDVLAAAPDFDCLAIAKGMSACERGLIVVGVDDHGVTNRAAEIQTEKFVHHRGAFARQRFRAALDTAPVRVTP